MLSRTLTQQNLRNGPDHGRSNQSNRLRYLILFFLFLSFVSVKSQTITVDFTIANNKNASPQAETTFCDGDELTFSATTTINDFCATGRTLSYSIDILNGSTSIHNATNSTGIFTFNSYTNPFAAFNATVVMSVSISGTETDCSTAASANDNETKSFTYTREQKTISFFTTNLSTICLNENIQLSSSGWWDYSTTTIAGDGVVFPNGITTPATPSSVGSKTYTMKGHTTNTCSLELSLSVTVKTLPTVTITPSQIPACINQSFNLTGGGAITYSWNSTTPGAGLAGFSGTTVNAIPTSSGSKTYNVTGTGSNGCNNTASLSINVIDGPPPSYTYIISQRTVTFTNTTPSYLGPGTVTYLWDFGDGSAIVSTPSNGPQVHTYANAQSYTAILKTRVTPGNCDKPYQQTFTIDATPIPNFTLPSEVCLKSDGNGGSFNTVVFTNTTTSNPTGKQSTFTYAWDFGDGTTLSGQTYSASISHSYSTIGTYTVKLTATNATGRETVFINKSITVHQNPEFFGATDYLSTTGHCQGRQVEFKMGSFSSVTYTSYPLSWEMDYDGNNTNGPNSDGFDGINSATYSTGFSPLQASFYHTNNTAGTITIRGRLKTTLNGCYTTFSESFTIDPTPTTTIQFSPSSTGMCKNTSTPTTISSSTAGSAYDWEYIPPSNTYWRPSNQTFNPNGTMLEIGTADINLKVQNSAGCWSDVVTGTFDIWDVPVPNFTNTTVCAINDVDAAFTNTTTGPQTTYAWDFGNSSGTSTLSNPTYDYNTAGSYNVKLTVTEGTHSCTDEITKSVTVKPNPTVDFSHGTIFCEQQAITFTDNSTLSGNTISSRYWDWNDGTNTTTSTQTQNHNFTPTFPGSTTSVNYNVVLTSTASNGCYDMKTRTITINKKPAQPTLSVATNAQNHTNVICVGEQYTLNASPSSGYSYSWFFNGNSMGAYYSNSITDYGVGPLPDSRPYSVRITDGNGCYNTSATSTILVKHVNTGIFYTSGYPTLCPGTTVTLSGNVPTPAQAYEWYKAPYDPVTMTFGAFGVVGTNSKTHLVDNSNPGRYKYKGTLSISGGDACIDESSTIDVINALPLTLNYTGTVNINLLSPQILNFIPSSYPIYSTYKWYRNDILVSTLASYPITKPGKYYLIATGSCGIEKSNVVEFKFDCSGVGYNNGYIGIQNFTGGTTNLNPGTVTPSTILMNGDWNLTSGAVVNISNITIVVGNCAKFNVTNGTLNLTNANIVGCAEWNGIVIDGMSSTLNMSGGTISEAVVGITSKNRGTLSVTQGEFDNNMVHIGFSSNGVVNSSLISFNKFGNLNLNSPSCTHPDLPAWNIVNKPMVYLEQVTGPSIVGNEFICNNTNNAIIVEGIQSKGSNSLTISNNSDQGYLSRGINIREGNALSIGDNTFNFRYFPPLDMFNSRSAWMNTGILMVDTKGSTVDRNLVTDADEGIAYYLNTAVPVTTTNIIRNRMENCTYGLVSATKENPATSVFPYQNSSAQTVYAQVNCNTFNSCNYGWIGTGTYPIQGGSTTPANNSFNFTTNWNTCVMSNINYYRSSSSGIYDPYGTALGIVSLDGNIINTVNKSTLCFLDPTTISTNSCTNKRSTTDQDPIDVPENAIGVEIKVSSFPNPFKQEIELRIDNNEDNKTFKVEFYDLTGKIILSGNVSESTQTFDTGDWAVGIYFIRVSNNEGTVYQQKLVKTE